MNKLLKNVSMAALFIGQITFCCLPKEPLALSNSQKVLTLWLYPISIIFVCLGLVGFYFLAAAEIELSETKYKLNRKLLIVAIEGVWAISLIWWLAKLLPKFVS